MMTVETFDRVSEAREVRVLEKGRRMLKSVLPLWLKMAFQSCLRAANDEGDAGVATEGVSVEEGMVEFDMYVAGTECESGAKCSPTAGLKSDGGVVEVSYFVSVQSALHCLLNVFRAMHRLRFGKKGSSYSLVSAPPSPFSYVLFFAYRVIE